MPCSVVTCRPVIDVFADLVSQTNRRLFFHSAGKCKAQITYMVSRLPCSHSAIVFYFCWLWGGRVSARTRDYSMQIVGRERLVERVGKPIVPVELKRHDGSCIVICKYIDCSDSLKQNKLTVPIDLHRGTYDSFQGANKKYFLFVWPTQWESCCTRWAHWYDLSFVGFII